MTKHHFADRWQLRPLVWTDDQRQPQCLDSENANVVLRLPLRLNLVPRDYVSEDEIATARAQDCRTSTTFGSNSSCAFSNDTNAARHASTPKTIYSKAEDEDNDGKQTHANISLSTQSWNFCIRHFTISHNGQLPGRGRFNGDLHTPIGLLKDIRYGRTTSISHLSPISEDE
jgi:hypothetical protein